MKRSNSFVDLAKRSRTVLMKETGMDDLDYHLTVLEGGTLYLDQVVKPGKEGSEELVALYKEHLTNIGFWNFYSFLFSHLEIALAQRWTKEGAIEAYQTAAWKRGEFIKEVQGLPWQKEANAQFDTWLKAMGRDRFLYPDRVTEPQKQH